MGWRWRKSISLGGARTTLSQSGLGFSYGFAGLRIGRSPSGNFWVSFTIPGTGISFFKYIGSNQSTGLTNQQPTTTSIQNQIPSSNQPVASLQTNNQRLLEKMKNIKP